MVKFEDYVMPGAAMGNLNPMPDIKNISYIHAGYIMTDKILEDEKRYIGKGMISTMLPYKIQDGYDRDKKDRIFKAAIVENDYLKAVFLPEFGGRLWSLYDKKNERELLYVNPVFQPGNLGLRNAWFSGGVEFNVGIKGHNPLTCSPLWCAVDECDGEEVLRLYEFERIRGVVYSISAYLPKSSSVLYIKNKIENKENKEKYMYWWSNIAVPETRGTRVIVPTDESFLSFYNEDHYILDKATIPLNEGIDVSYPGNIPSSRDFFYKIPKNCHKWIATANEEGKGLLHCSTKELISRKLFVWGMGQGGRNWNEWLSEEGSAYIEIQAGLANTQLEHIPMKGNEVWEWTETYSSLDIAAKTAHGDYFEAVEKIEDYITEHVGNPDTLTFPLQKNTADSKIVYAGSAWGAVEEMIRGESISDVCKFPYIANVETAEWVSLITDNTFPVPDVDKEPVSYVADRYLLNKLEGLPKQSWYSLLHIGVIRYALGDIEGSLKAWEESVKMCSSPWALRNLSMLYKNEYKNSDLARKYILDAFEMKKDCPTLCCEVASQLTGDGNDELWLEIYETLSDKLKYIGRLRLYKAIAYINLGRLIEATDIINSDFVMNDIKEGEVSVSQIWFKLYRRLYAEEKGTEFNPDDTSLIAEADRKYPLPKKLDFRMHD